MSATHTNSKTRVGITLGVVGLLGIAAFAFMFYRFPKKKVNYGYGLPSYGYNQPGTPAPSYGYNVKVLKK